MLRVIFEAGALEILDGVAVLLKLLADRKAEAGQATVGLPVAFEIVRQVMFGLVKVQILVETQRLGRVKGPRLYRQAEAVKLAGRGLEAQAARIRLLDGRQTGAAFHFQLILRRLPAFGVARLPGRKDRLQIQDYLSGRRHAEV